MTAPSPTKPTLVVLAAGIGSRYGGLKQIEPVGPSGEIVIEYALYDALRAGFGKAVFVIRRDIEESFRGVIEPHFAGRIPFEYVYQELSDVPGGFAVPADRPKPWGTGHAVYACRHAVREPFAVINADDFYGRTSFAVLAERLASLSPDEARYSLVAFVLRNTLSEHGPVARGVCTVGPDGRLQAVTERKGIEKHNSGARYLDGHQWVVLTGDERVSMNLWGFTPTVFGFLETAFRAFLPTVAAQPAAELFLPSVVDTLIHRGEAAVDVLDSHERWLGVTYPQDRAAVAAGVRELVRAGAYPEKLW